MSPETIESINRVALCVHENARAHGFHDDTQDEFVAKTTANMHGEVSEFWEAFRKGELFTPCDKNCELNCAEEELADIIIRALDTSKRLGLNIGEAISRVMHGDKKA